MPLPDPLVALLVLLRRHHAREDGREAGLEQGAPRGLRDEGRDPDQLEGGGEGNLLVGHSPRIVLGRKKEDLSNNGKG